MDEAARKRREEYKGFLWLSEISETGTSLTPEYLEAAASRRDFSTPPEESPSVIAYVRTLDRAGSEPDDEKFLEVFREEFARAKAEALKK